MGDPPRLGTVKKSHSWPSISPSRTSKSRPGTNSFSHSFVYSFIPSFIQQTFNEHLQNARPCWVRIKDEPPRQVVPGPQGPTVQKGRQWAIGCSSQHWGETSTIAEIRKYLIMCGRNSKVLYFPTKSCCKNLWASDLHILTTVCFSFVLLVLLVWTRWTLAWSRFKAWNHGFITPQEGHT